MKKHSQPSSTNQTKKTKKKMITKTNTLWIFMILAMVSYTEINAQVIAQVIAQIDSIVEVKNQAEEDDLMPLKQYVFRRYVVSQSPYTDDEEENLVQETVTLTLFNDNSAYILFTEDNLILSLLYETGTTMGKRGIMFKDPETGSKFFGFEEHYADRGYFLLEAEGIRFTFQIDYIQTEFSKNPQNRI